MKRFSFTREFYTPKSYVQIQKVDEIGVTVFASVDGLLVMGFSGKRQKPDFHIRFGEKERAENHVSSWLDGLMIRAQEKRALRQKRSETPNPLVVGDVLRSSWGYEQTNVDYYEVTAVVGKHTVEIREIARESENTECMQGVCVPCPGKFIGESMRKRVDDRGGVKITSFSWARKVESKIVGGIKVFKPDAWTAYA